MRKGIEKLINFYNKREDAIYEPYISYLRETELSLKDVGKIDYIAHRIGVKKDDDLMKRFVSDIRNYGKNVVLFGYPDYAVSDDETKAKLEEVAKKAEEVAKELAETSADVARAGLVGLKAGVDAAVKAYKESRNK